jgi:hypothetical protein
VVADALTGNTAPRRVLKKADLTLVRPFRVIGADCFAGTEQELIECALWKADGEQPHTVGAGGGGGPRTIRRTRDTRPPPPRPYTRLAAACLLPAAADRDVLPDVRT